MNASIIILHFGKVATTQACVKSILKFEKKYHSIVIVNNDSYPLKRGDFPNATNIFLIQNAKNLGFAAGVNVGIRYALNHGVDSVLLLNNDTVLSQPIVQDLCDDFAEHPSIGIVGPAIAFMRKGKKVYDLGGYINVHTGKTHHDNEKKIPFEILQFPNYVSGCCMLVKKEIFEKIGFFDERFFLYYEDVDFCLRAKQAGFFVALDPGVILYHELSKAAGKCSKITLYHQTRSAIKFGEKYFGNSPKRLINSGFILLQSLVFIKNNPRSGWAAFQAMTDALRGR